MLRFLALLILLVTLACPLAAAPTTLELAKGTTLLLDDSSASAEKDAPIEIQISYQCGLLDDPIGSEGAMAVLAAFAFESAGARGSANYQAEIKALDELDRLEAELAKLEALEKRSEADAKRQEELASLIADQRLGTDFLGVGAPLNDLYFRNQAADLGFRVGPDNITISLRLPRKALPLLFEVEGERRRDVLLRKFDARHSMAADVAVYAIATPSIDRSDLAKRYLRSGGPYGRLVSADYSFDKLSGFARPLLRKLWLDVMSQAPMRIAIGVKELSEQELAAAKQHLPALTNLREPKALESEGWKLSQVRLYGEPKAERWYALRGATNLSLEESRRLDAWLGEHFDSTEKGLSHRVDWLARETLIGFSIGGKAIEGMDIEASQFALRTPVKAMLYEFASAKLSSIEMKNLRPNLLDLAEASPLAIQKNIGASAIAASLNAFGGMEMVWRPAPKAEAETPALSRADALKEVIKGETDPKRLAELKRILAKLESEE